MGFNELAAFKSNLIRKALNGVVLVAPYSAAALTDICTSGGALAALTGHESMGKLTTDGLVFSGDETISDVTGWGDYTGPSRRDLTNTTSSFSFTPMESKVSVWESYFNVALDSAATDVSTGTLTYDLPSVPTLTDRRVLALAQDVNKETGADIYIGVYYPRANISKNGDQTMAPGDTPIQYPMTATSLLDDAEGTGVRLFWGGPGFTGDILTDMGVTPGT